MVIYQRVTSNIYATETRTKPAEIILLILQCWGFFSIYSYTYKINYFTFVFSGPRCPNVLKNCQFINCQYNIGDSCSYKCNYPFEVNPSVKKLTCDKDGEWSHDTNDLCCKFINTVVNIIQTPKQICVLAIYVKIAIDNVKIFELIHNNNNQYINGLIAKYPSIIQCCLNQGSQYSISAS